ncbi:MAG: hypothetical protein WA584_20935 [Pyrinomonadaceae bacterium]
METAIARLTEQHTKAFPFFAESGAKKFLIQLTHTLQFVQSRKLYEKDKKNYFAAFNFKRLFAPFTLNTK